MVAGLNPNHVRVLTTTFAHLDHELAALVGALQAQDSPLSRYANDLSAEQRTIALDHIEQVRDRLAAAARRLGLPPPGRTPISSALNAALMFAQNALADVAPPRLRGYGPLGVDAADQVATTLSDLDRAIERLIQYFERPAANDLAARIGGLGAAGGQQALLAQLEPVVTRHGLVELRPAIMALIDLFEVGTFEVAIFGRVSTGKSSLINTIVGAGILPVGATPVTSVPTRVRGGAAFAVSIRYIDGREESVPREGLAALVTETGNPNNRRGVARVTVDLPTGALGPIVLVDTPGVGSLSTHGTRAAYGYLPRCDLGVLLIEAASAVTLDDVDLPRRLAESGIEAQVVLAKVDLVPTAEGSGSPPEQHPFSRGNAYLRPASAVSHEEPVPLGGRDPWAFQTPAERDRVRAYFEHELEHALGRTVPVDVVSTTGSDAELAQAWFGRRVAPLAARAHDALAESATRKLAALLASVIAVLRASRGAGAAPPVSREQIEHAALLSRVAGALSRAPAAIAASSRTRATPSRSRSSRWSSGRDHRVDEVYKRGPAGLPIGLTAGLTPAPANEIGMCVVGSSNVP